MRTLIVLYALFAALAATAQPDSVDTQAKRLAQEALIVDTHIDMPYRVYANWADVAQSVPEHDFDAPRSREGGLDVAFMSIYLPAATEATDEATTLANRLIDLVEAQVARAPDTFAIATSPGQAERIVDSGRIALPLGMENGAAIDGDLDNLEHFFNRGIRYITLAHSKANHIADSSYDPVPVWHGLSPFGVTLVREMNRLGMMIDLSHVTDQAVRDALEVSRAPVIASHSSARHFTPDFERNLPDELIEAIAEQGGIVMINFGSSFLTAEANQWQQQFSAARANVAEQHALESNDHPVIDAFTEAYRQKHPYPYAEVADVVDHIEHVIDIAGIDHVGLGSDYDGVGDSLPEGLKDVSTYPNLIAELLRRGHSESDIRAILGGNLMRVWRAVEQHAGAGPN